MFQNTSETSEMWKYNKTSSARQEFWVHVKNTCLWPLKIPLISISGLFLGRECNECHYTCKKITELNKHLTSNFFYMKLKKVQFVGKTEA